MKTAIFLYPRFSEYELSVALSVLKQGNHEIVTVGLNSDVVVGEAGLACVPALGLQDINLRELDGLVLPGCDDIGHLQDETNLFEFVRNIAGKGAVVAAISSAPFLLAKSGVLEDHRYTVAFNREQRDFIGVFNEENYVDAPLVSDGKIVTSKGAYFIDFGIQLGRLLYLAFDPSWYR